MRNKGEVGKKIGCRWIIKQSCGTKRYLFILILSRLIFTAMNLAFAMVLGAFMNYATGVRTYSLLGIALVAVILCLVEGLIFVTESICKKAIYSNMEKKMRIDTLSKIQNSSVLEIQSLNSSEIMMRLTNDIEQVANCLQLVIINVFGGIVMAIAALCYMFYLSWRLTIIIIITIPILILIISIFAPIVENCSKKGKENEDVNRKEMDDVIKTVTLTRIFSANSLLLDKVKKSYNSKYKSSVKLGYVDGIFSFFNNLMGSIMFLVTLGVGAYFTSKGDFTVGSMIAVINLLNYVVWPFSNISSSISGFSQAIVSASRIDELQQFPQSDEDKKHIIYRRCDGDESWVDMKDISFGYRDKDILLKNINLSLYKNKIVGLIGRNGCGKSTLIKILLGIYSPTSGNVTIFDKDVDIRKQNHNIIAYVPSSNYVFSGTIRENICMAENANQSKMIECAKKRMLMNLL